MNPERLRAAYAGLIRRPGPGREHCPSAEQLDALARRAGDEAERLATLNHAMACTECRRELDLLRAVERAALEPVQRAWSPRLFALAATMMLATGALLIWRATRPAGDVLRGDSSTPVLLAPADGAELVGDGTLAWRPVTGAITYQVEVLDRDDRLVLWQPTTDTTLAIAPGAFPGSGTYRWRVVATLPAGGALASPYRRVMRRAP
jgi:hypothetical protein